MGSRRNARRSFDKYAIGSYILIALYTIFALAPVYWMISTSFKSPLDTRKLKVFPFIDFNPVTKTWEDVLFGDKAEMTIKALKNGLIVGASSAVLCTALSSLAGYGLAKFRYRRWKNRDIASFILAQRMMPPAVVALPIFIFFSTLNLIDTPISLILIETAVNMPLIIWILMDFFRGVPNEIEDAAYIDGLTIFQTFYKISLRLAAPGIAVALVLSFILSWNEFFFVLVLAYSEAITIPWLVSLGYSQISLEYWTISAYGTLSIIPPIILAFFIQKYIIRGLTFGAVKG